MSVTKTTALSLMAFTISLALTTGAAQASPPKKALGTAGTSAAKPTSSGAAEIQRNADAASDALADVLAPLSAWVAKPFGPAAEAGAAIATSQAIDKMTDTLAETLIRDQAAREQAERQQAALDRAARVKAEKVKAAKASAPKAKSTPVSAPSPPTGSDRKDRLDIGPIRERLDGFIREHIGRTA